MSIKDILFSLCSAPDMGNSVGAADVVSELLSKYAKPSIDAMGNVKGTTKGNGRHILLDAHIDEIGFVVTSICDDGFLKVSKYGGIDIRTLPAKEVTIWGKYPVYGLFTASAPHLTKSEDYKKAVKLEDISIDTGLDDKTLRDVVSLGDRVTFKADPLNLVNGRVTSKAIDDRAGVAVILRTLEILSNTTCSAKVTALFSTQEEVGTRGASTGAYDAECDEAVAVDVSFAMQQDAPEEKCGKLGKGPMIGISPILNRDGFDKMKLIAENMNIPYQIEVMSGETGTNADVITLVKSGIKTSLLSVPIRNMHTPAEIADISDLENTAKLLAAYISSYDEKRV